MNYEIQSALARKVDEHQHSALASQVSSLKYDVQNLRTELERSESSRQNHYQAIVRLIDTMVESGLFENDNSLIEIKHYL